MEGRGHKGGDSGTFRENEIGKRKKKKEEGGV